MPDGLQRWFVLTASGNITLHYPRVPSSTIRRTPSSKTCRASAALWGFPTFLSTNFPHSCRPIQIGIAAYIFVILYGTVTYFRVFHPCCLLPRCPLPRFQSPHHDDELFKTYLNSISANYTSTWYDIYLETNREIITVIAAVQWLVIGDHFVKQNDIIWYRTYKLLEQNRYLTGIDTL